MDISKKPLPLTTICGIRKQIDTNPDYQRPAVWSLSQKQLLINTVLQNYDIPKLYWRKIRSNPEKYEVVDGQQRLRAIWEFHSGGFALTNEIEDIDGFSISSKKYEDLPIELRTRFDIYPLDIVIIQTDDEEEVREMFLRLQNGTTLKAQERRNAMSGNMRDFVKELSEHRFFLSCGFDNSRYTFDHIAAQVTLIELEGGPCNVKNANLNKLYKENTNFDKSGQIAKKIRRVLDFLLKAFPEKTPELERYNVISLYTMASNLLERYVFLNRYEDLAKWFIGFETYRRNEIKLSEDDVDPELISYHEKISHSTDSIDSISWRHEFLLRKFFESIPDIELKDDQRIFTREQRLAIYRREGGICQVKTKCEGVRCTWDNWEADHIKPWSQGGKTTVLNGQVACPECNASKGSGIL